MSCVVNGQTPTQRPTAQTIFLCFPQHWTSCSRASRVLSLRLTMMISVSFEIFSCRLHRVSYRTEKWQSIFCVTTDMISYFQQVIGPLSPLLPCSPLVLDPVALPLQCSVRGGYLFHRLPSRTGVPAAFNTMAGRNHNLNYQVQNPVFTAIHCSATHTRSPGTSPRDYESFVVQRTVCCTKR